MAGTGFHSQSFSERPWGHVLAARARGPGCDGAEPPPLAIGPTRDPAADEYPTKTVATAADARRRDDAGDSMLVSRRERRGGPVRAQVPLGLQRRHVPRARAGLHGPPPDAARAKVRGGPDLEPERSQGGALARRAVASEGRVEVVARRPRARRPRRDLPRPPRGERRGLRGRPPRLLVWKGESVGLSLSLSLTPKLSLSHPSSLSIAPADLRPPRRACADASPPLRPPDPRPPVSPPRFRDDRPGVDADHPGRLCRGAPRPQRRARGRRPRPPLGGRLLRRRTRGTPLSPRHQGPREKKVRDLCHHSRVIVLSMYCNRSPKATGR